MKLKRRSRLNRALTAAKAGRCKVAHKLLRQEASAPQKSRARRHLIDVARSFVGKYCK